MIDGGSAFPRQPGEWKEFMENGHKVRERDDCGSFGMTLRDYFAAHALIMAGVYNVVGEKENFGSAALGKEIAETAYQLADAMLAAREKPTGVNTNASDE
jgi:hypothetical protein